MYAAGRERATVTADDFMATDFTKSNPELEALFRKYENAPDSYVFAPLADAYRKAGMLDEAVEVCRKGVRKNPGYPSGHVVLGKCYFDVGEVDMAGESFNAVLELDENNLVALKYLGMIQAGRGRLDAAREHFKHILVLDPENREIMGMLEDLHEADAAPAPESVTQTARREPPQGREPSRRADGDGGFEGGPISLGDDADETSDELATTTLADIYAAQGFPEKAARIYREVLRKQPDNLEIKQKLIDLEGETGESFAEIVEDPPFAGDVDAEGMEEADAPGAASGEEPIETAPGAAGDEEQTAEEPKPAEKTAVSSKPTPSEDSSMGDHGSYDQFKRWLKNLQE
jgi:tetratricopeptide (TPR) repeat protein